MSQAIAGFNTNRPALSRRAFLTATGSTLAGTAIAAAPLAMAKAAEPLPDAELLELIRQWQEAEDAYKAQLDPLEAAERRYYAMVPDMPQALTKTEHDVRLGLTAPLHQTASPTFQPEVFNTWRGKPMRRQVSHPVTPALRQRYKLPEDAHTLSLMEPWPEKQARADGIIKAWDDWQAAKEKANRESGLEEAEAEHDRLLEAESKLRKQIALTPAQSTLGIMLKAKVCGALWGGLDELETDLAGELDERATNETMAWSVVRDLMALNQRTT